MKDVKRFEDLINDEDKKRGVIRALEIIGEATKKIPADVKYNWSSVEWKSIAGMRDKLIHDYMGVDYDIVWNTVHFKIPDLKKKIEVILETTA